MTDLEVNEFIEREVKALWTEWKPTDAGLEAWIRNLRPFDYKIAKRAAQEFYATRDGSFKTPKLHAIVEKANLYKQAENPNSAREKSGPTTNVFVQCIEHNNPIRLYQFSGVYVSPTDRQNDHDYVMRCAESTCRRYNNLYGGIWIIVQQTNEREMSKQMREYRQKLKAD